MPLSNATGEASRGGCDSLDRGVVMLFSGRTFRVAALNAACLARPDSFGRSPKPSARFGSS